MRGVQESLSIHVIDDDDAVRDSLAALLEPEGFTVRTYSSANEFLENLRKFHPGGGGRACVLLDLHMPGQGGQEVLDGLARSDIDIPVVVMTGNTSERTRRQALAGGATEFLEKPVDADRLIEALRTALDKFCA